MRRATVLAGFLGYGGALYALRPSGSQLPRGDWWGWLQADPERALLLALAGTAWLLAAWLFTVAGLSLVSATSSVLGQLAARLVSLLAPIAVRRAVAAAVGTALALGPAGMAAAGQSQLGPPAAVTVNTLTQPPAPTVAPAALPLPDLDRPTAMPKTASPRPSPSSHANPRASPPPSRSQWPSVTRSPAAAPPAATHPVAHTVAPGDTLWDLAAAELPPDATGADITRAWQDWYTRNRAAIGPDPGLLLPGQLLTAPSVTP